MVTNGLDTCHCCQVPRQDSPANPDKNTCEPILICLLLFLSKLDHFQGLLISQSANILMTFVMRQKNRPPGNSESGPCRLKNQGSVPGSDPFLPSSMVVKGKPGNLPSG